MENLSHIPLTTSLSGGILPLLVFGIVCVFLVLRRTRERGLWSASTSDMGKGSVDGEVHEPPVVEHWIPYVGHLFGLIRFGVSYFDRLR